MAAEDPIETAVELAGRLLASQPGSAARVLAGHRRRPDGDCTGCGPTRTGWPCVVVLAARRARRLEPPSSGRVGAGPGRRPGRTPPRGTDPGQE